MDRYGNRHLFKFRGNDRLQKYSMKYKTVLYPKPDNYDHNDIRWETPDGKVVGFGYMGKADKEIHIQRCPRCHNENYMAQTVCISCGFSPSPVEETHEKA